METPNTKTLMILLIAAVALTAINTVTLLLPRKVINKDKEVGVVLSPYAMVEEENPETEEEK